MKWYRIRGYNRITAAGSEKERFLKLCHYHEIELYRLMHMGDRFVFDIDYDNLQKLKELADKTEVKLNITRGRGIGLLLRKLRKRYFLVVFIIAMLAMNFTMGQFVWHITINGNQQLTREMLIDFLHDQGCVIGIAKRKIDCELLENRLRDEYPYITWVCIQTSGSKLTVSVKENELILDAGETLTKEETESGYNLISKNDGVITNLLIRNGCTRYKVGDEITTGEIIVEGQIPIYNITGDTVIDYTAVVPEADMRIQVKQQYCNGASKSESHKVRTGRCVRFPYMVIGNHIYESSKESCFEQEECIRTFRQLHVFGDLYLPVYFGCLEVYELCEYTSLNSYQTLLKKIENEYQAYHKSLYQEGCVVISEKHSIFDTKEGLVLEADMIVERKAHLAAAKPAVAPEQELNE